LKIGIRRVGHRAEAQGRHDGLLYDFRERGKTLSHQGMENIS